MNGTIRITLALAAFAPAAFSFQPVDETKAEKKAYAKAYAEEGELSEKAAKLVAAVLEDAASGTTYECTDSCTAKSCSDECPAMHSPKAQLSKAVAYYPKAMDTVAPLTVAALKDKATTEAQSEALLGCMLESRSPALGELGDKLCSVAPKRLGTLHLMAFTDAGSKLSLEPLTKLVKKGEGGVPAAALLAFRGDSAGKRTLQNALKTKEVSADNALDVLLAGYAMDSIGDHKARAYAQRKVHGATLAALDSGHLEAARAMAISAELMNSVMRHEQRGLSTISLRFQKYQAEAGEKLAKAEQVFDLIESNTPLL